LKSRPNQRWICQLVHTCQMHIQCKLL